MSGDQVSFYDESLKKQVEGYFTSDGQAIHVRSVYGAKSASYTALGANIDYNSQVLLARKMLSEMARDPDSGFKELQKQKGAQQVQPRESFSCSGIRG